MPTFERPQDTTHARRRNQERGTGNIVTMDLIIGTRPEAIKMAPLALALRRRGVEARIISTGQHQQVVTDALALFGIAADVALNIFEHGQSLSSISARALHAVDGLLSGGGTDAVVVQGDTNSAAAAGIAAAYRQVTLVHLEAGLRTGVKSNPFPEELNRRMISSIADLHLTPTVEAKSNLVAEGIEPSAIITTGNTVIDAALHVAAAEGGSSAEGAQSLGSAPRTILVTAHRRESWGARMAGALSAVGEVARANPDVEVLLAAHPNPAVQHVVESVLGNQPRVRIVPPLSYVEFIRAMASCYVVVTDSGGVQEEAPSFGKPVLVMRDTTERPEGVRAGVAALVGTDPERIRTALSELLHDPGRYQAMARAVNPYGDGRAGDRAADAILWFSGRASSKPEDFKA